MELMRTQIVEKEELGILFIVLSIKDNMLLPTGKARYELVFGRQTKDFLRMQNSKNTLKKEHSPLNNSVMLIIVDDRHTM